MFKTTKGKYVAPAPIEGLLAAHPYIEQVCVMGSGKDQPVAIAELSETARNSNQIDVAEAIYHHMQTMNQELEHHERVAQILLTQIMWTVEEGLITPTLKVRRDQVEDRYLPTLERMPADEPVVWAPKVESSSATEAA